MKFAPNRMYVEAYHKCVNCGLLLYEKPAQAGPTLLLRNGRIYCSEWCVAWEADRTQRLQAEAVAAA